MFEIILLLAIVILPTCGVIVYILYKEATWTPNDYKTYDNTYLANYNTNDDMQSSDDDEFEGFEDNNEMSKEEMEFTLNVMAGYCKWK